MTELPSSARLPLYRALALGASGLLLIDLFVPWFATSVATGPLRFVETHDGWRGIGTFAGVVTLTLVAWESARWLGHLTRLRVRHDLITAALAGLAAVLTAAQFLRAVRSRTEYEGLAELGVEVQAGAGWAAWASLPLVAALFYVTYQAWQAGRRATLPAGPPDQDVSDTSDAHDASDPATIVITVPDGPRSTTAEPKSPRHRLSSSTGATASHTKHASKQHAAQEPLNGRPAPGAD